MCIRDRYPKCYTSRLELAYGLTWSAYACANQYKAHLSHTERRVRQDSRESSPPMEATQPARTERPRTRIGRPFQKGNSGRPKGLRDHRQRVGLELLKAIAEEHLGPVLEKLCQSKSERIQFEVARWLGEMLLGRPKASVEIAGGFGDLAKELSAALASARERRTLEAAKPVLEAQIVPDASPRASLELERLGVGAVGIPCRG